ncbi:MAG: Hsp20 family protein [Holosporaceae bacterium]|nr:Hsp20 family protein [Holosporaceae bacterium]
MDDRTLPFGIGRHWFLGLNEDFEKLVDLLSKTPDGSYPPYNIEQIGERGFRITLALAGFKKENIRISIENNQLTIRGKQDADSRAVYIYRGIATRQFIKTFFLADGVEVQDAEFDNGILQINLLITSPSNARVIEIKGGSSTKPAIQKIEKSVDAYER